MKTYTFKVSMGGLHQLVSRVFKFASKNEPAFEGVHFFIADGQLWAEATDRRHLLCRRIKCELDDLSTDYDKCDFVLDAPNVKKLLKAVKKDNTIARAARATLTVKAGALTVDDPYDRQATTFPLTQGKYQNVHKLFNLKREEIADGPISFTRATLAALAPSTDLGSSAVTLWPTEGSAWVFAADENEVGLVAPFRLVEDGSIDPQPLMDLLAQKGKASK